ncbi:THI80 [Candida oxycetoniae]|uniref:Thiamine pyrophosphokinase n=1 Tax=Candida oxycetoniae TaxID=497107 RepID=A0AAI9SUH1_9ASCO|nr:THI80 [Candida oxycetoniae]KAI3403291.1 THI80 [Candida oxycetoniae]
MSREEELKKEVTVQPNSLVIERPKNGEEKTDSFSCSYRLIEPFSYLSHDGNQNRALLILNQEIDLDLIPLWELSSIVVCADGAANRLYEYFANKPNLTKDTCAQLQSKYIPNYIVGDFDSIDKEIAQFYKSQGAHLIEQSSEYINDFSKAILCIQLHFQFLANGEAWPDNIEVENGLSQIWETKFSNLSSIPIKVNTLSAIGGRFDQTIQSINQLYILHQTAKNLEIFFHTHNDIIFLLYKGVNYVAYPSKTTFSRMGDKIPPTCGLLPLSNKPIILSSHGLKYDVKHWKTQMMGYVSSSNRIVGETGFIVECSDDIVMNIEVDF